MIGGAAQVTAACSEIDSSIDNGSPNDDHSLVSLQVVGESEVGHRPQCLWRPRFGVEKIKSDKGRRVSREACQSFQQPARSVHPDLHRERVQDHLVATLQQHFRMPSKAGKASLIPDEVWKLREQKNLSSNGPGDAGTCRNNKWGQLADIGRRRGVNG